MKNHIILYRSNNTPGKHDATGAFEPEAKALGRLLLDRYPQDNVAIRGVDLSATRGLPRDEKERKRRSLRRDAINSAWNELVKADPLADPFEIASLSYFCHGWRRAVEFEAGGLHGAHRCAEMLISLGVKYLNLFACSTGKPHHDGNFAQWVAQACADRRHPIQVMAHETSGHTSCNARLAFFWSVGTILRDEPYGVSSATAIDRDKNQLLEPGAAFGAFAARMREDQNYRLLLPFLLDE